jgi:hypothetical protein
MNGIGESEVLDHFVEEGWLGLIVQPINPPDWLKRQNPDCLPSHVFGAEIK